MGDDVSIPIPTLRGRLLCFFGFHQWQAMGARTKVIPTGNALLITSREQETRCRRHSCTAKRVNHYHRNDLPTSR